MSIARPKFVDSKYFVGEMNNWHLLPDAPKEIKEEFEEYVRMEEEARKKGIVI